ncbi:hypothetical protein [Nocardioides humi]|uniref:Uncharacterized protein n=1 Tax=Nocardioides humi TaxID=449461 RepID=A0ABN2BEJ5_9ACTN|nr:hypothetical protein [Nocardioides humi]
MTDEEWLRAGLADAVPEAPAVPDRAAGARTLARRARRTTLLAAGGVAASVLVVVAIIATPGDGGRVPDHAADRSPTAPVDAGACPPDPVDARTRTGPDHVPDGAASVRLCEGDGGPIEVPADALVTDVDEVAAAVNGLDLKSPDTNCTAELGPGYQLVFAYADGSTVVASGALYGCREVVVDGVERLGADLPWQRFIDLLRDQRERLAPPAAPDAAAIDCARDPASPTLGRPQDLAVAVLCVADGPPAPISAAELDLLLDDLDANTRRNAGYVDCGAPPPFPRFVGLTAWADRVEVRSDCGNGWFSVDDATNSVWRPGPEARALIERLVGEAG